MRNPSKPDETLIVYFGNDWFAENRTSSHHIARLLSERYPLIYVESPGLRAPTNSSRDIRKLFRKLALAFKRPRRIGERMWLISVPQIPFRSLPFVPALNRYLGRAMVRRAMRAVTHSTVISWFVVPHPHQLARTLGEALVVYYCVDDYAAFPGMNVKSVIAMDHDLTLKADLIFAVSQPLVESKRALNARTFYSPHGVDFAMFAKACDPETAIPAQAQNLSRPVIGFFGVIGAWMDLPLLKWLAESRPDWTFLMVGLISTSVDDLQLLPNVRFAGPQPYPSLPAWAKVFDVAIIPTLRNRQRLFANPLKLREYLATGRPVVATPTSATESFPGAVHLASTPAEFLAGIEQALREDSDENRSKRQACVSCLTWEKRFEEVDQIVQQALASKS